MPFRDQIRDDRSHFGAYSYFHDRNLSCVCPLIISDLLSETGRTCRNLWKELKKSKVRSILTGVWFLGGDDADAILFSVYCVGTFCLQRLVHHNLHRYWLFARSFAAVIEIQFGLSLTGSRRLRWNLGPGLYFETAPHNNLLSKLIFVLHHPQIMVFCSHAWSDFICKNFVLLGLVLFNIKGILLLRNAS